MWVHMSSGRGGMWWALNEHEMRLEYQIKWQRLDTAGAGINLFHILSLFLCFLIQDGHDKGMILLVPCQILKKK